MNEQAARFRTSFVLAITLLGAALSFQPFLAAEKPDAASSSPLRQPRTDSLGDVLPDHALLRLGTLRFRQPSDVTDLALSPDEKTVVTIGSDDLIAWDQATGKQLWRANSREHGINLTAAAYGVRALAFAPDGSVFYTPGKHNQVIVWDVASGTSEVLSFKGTLPGIVGGRISNSKAIDVSRDGRKLAVGSAAGIVVCNDQGDVLFEIANKPNAPLDFAGRDRLTFGGDYSYGLFSPDEKILAIVTSDSPEEILLLDADTGDELRRIKLTSRLVRFAFSPDSSRIVATERDVAARLYAVASGGEIWSYVIDPNTTAESYTCAVAYSPDAKIIAACAPVGSDYDIRLLDAETGREIGNLTGHAWKPWALAFTADSKVLYSSGWDGAVRRWDVSRQQQLALPQGIRATPVVATSPNGRMLAYSDDSGTIRLVDANSGMEIRTLELPGSTYTQLAFSPDSQSLAGGGATDDSVQVAIWELTKGDVIHCWQWPKGPDPHSVVESLCFRSDGKQLAAAVFRQSAAYLWDLTTGQQIAQLRHGAVYGLSFSPDGGTLATAGWDKVIRFWNTSTGEKRDEIYCADRLNNNGDHRMYTVCYAPAGGILATAHLDGKLRVWNATDMDLLKEFQVKGRFIYGAICFSPDGSLLATGSMGGAVELWDPLTAEVVWDGGKHESYVYTVSFGADSGVLVSGGDDGVCYLWDLQPSEQPPHRDLDALWKDLAGNGATAYRATWAMTQTPDRTVALIGAKLRGVTSLMDLDGVVAGLSAEEATRRKRLATILADKDESVELVITVKRAVSLLRRLGTKEAIALLEELADRATGEDVKRLAAAALERAS